MLILVEELIFVVISHLPLVDVGPSLFARSRDSEEVAFVPVVLEQLPELPICHEMKHTLITQVVAGSGTAGQVLQSLTDETSFSQVVASMNLGIGFLQQHHPHLIVHASTEEWLAARLTGNQVVDGYFFPESVFAYSYSVNTFLIPVLCYKQPFNERWPLTKNGHGTEEVGIVQQRVLARHLDIGWFNRVIEDVQLSVVKLPRLAYLTQSS